VISLFIIQYAWKKNQSRSTRLFFFFFFISSFLTSSFHFFFVHIISDHFIFYFITSSLREFQYTEIFILVQLIILNNMTFFQSIQRFRKNNLIFTQKIQRSKNKVCLIWNLVEFSQIDWWCKCSQNRRRE
jgi:hypothetical protein